MAKIPIKFKRVAAAFDEAAKWRRPCDDSSSGSEYWTESGGASLSDLVNSFIEKGEGLDPFEIMNMDMDTDMNVTRDSKEAGYYEFDGNCCGSDSEEDYNEKKELLRGCLLECKCDKGVKQKILHEVQVALKLFGRNDNLVDSNNTSRSDVKRNVMSHLRDKGFDAGLCKSRWGKTDRYTAGTFEYIDVVIGERRYMIELFMSEELEIVRPTTRYTSLLDMIPSILITKNPQVLKKIIRLMCAAMKDSMKHSDMYVAPWRRNGFTQAKYFSPYKRTINRDSTAKMAKEGLAKKGTKVGFEADLPRVPYYCRDDGFASKVKSGLRVGLLAAALQGR